MTDNLENKETVNNAEVEVKADEPKTYTQAEVDKIVQGVRHKDKKKYQAKIDELNADLKYSDAQLADARLVQNVLNEGGGISGSLSDVAKQLAEQYGVSDDNMNRLRNNASTNSREAQKNMAYIEAERIVSDLDDEEMQEMYDTISEKPVSERTLTEKRILKKIESKVSKPKGKEDIDKMIEADTKWLNEQVEGVKLEDLVNDEEFKQFMADTGVGISSGIKAFIRYNKQYVIDNLSPKRTSTPSTGSVKDSGTSKLKEHYTPEDVDNLSEKDLDDPVIFERVRQSMTKWK